MYWEELLKYSKKNEMDKSHTDSEDLRLINMTLKRAREYGLEAEVMWSAMRSYAKYHESAPETYNIKWALDVALNEWDI